MTKLRLLIIVFLSFIGFTVNAQGVNDVDSILIHINDVQVMSSYAKREINKPIVLSTIKSDDLLKKLGNQEFPEMMKYTPSIYATKMGGGFGDSRLTLRGFGSENISVLMNGVPINGMENGNLYWSNWSGLPDVAHRIQVQRGIGLSKLGLFSVGGTVNIITKGAEVERNGWVSFGVGNDGYQKMGVGFSTGLTDNGWALSFMGTRTKGDGYVNATNFEAWSYFLSVSKRFNERHSLEFTVFGTPQWHNRRGNKHSIESYENNPDGIRMNTSYGYLNGEVLSTYSGYNQYHKPQLSLNHFWNIGRATYLSTSVYASLASGGGRKVYGDQNSANRIQFDYKNGLPIYDKDKKLVTDLTPDGLIDYLPLMEDNRASDHGSDAIFTMGTNSHDWYGVLSTLSHHFGNKLTLSVGFDGRYYKGYHYDKISDLLGGSYFKDNKLAWRDPETKLKIGDRVGTDYFSEIFWLGGFAQLEYNSEKYQVFVSTSVTNHKYMRNDKGRYGEFSDQTKYPSSMRRTSWRDFVPMSLKAGFNYRITEQHRLFINGGYVTRAPMLENIYIDNTPITNPVTEKIATVELGYHFTTEKVSVMLNGYSTNWMDKSATKPIGSWSGPKACIPDLDAVHKGIELEVSYTPLPLLRLSGFFTYGDWRWANDVNFSYVDVNNEKKGEYNAYIKDLHVGNAPQTSGYLSASWECLKGLVIGADFNYYGRFYADFSAIDRVNEEDRSDSWKLPDYSTVDVNMSYDLKFSKTMIQFFGTINNLFNAKYIADATDGAKHNRESASVWYGFGTTWTAGVRFKF